MMYELVATTVRGLEEIAINEVEELVGVKAERDTLTTVGGQGRIKFKADEKAIFTLNYCSNSLHRVIILLNYGEFSTLHEIYEATKEIDFAKFIGEEQTFAVVASRFATQGSHDFTSLDVASQVGQGVIDSFSESTGKRLKVNLKHPDVVISAGVVDNRFWIGIDTTGESLHKRKYRVYQHPAPLKASIAYAMVRISAWKSHEKFIDPFCGSGTIPIEAARYACKMPNFLRDFLFWRLKFLPLDAFREEKERVDERIEHKNLEIYGSDVSPKHVEGARMNANAAKVCVKFFEGDATKIKLDYDRIVTNLPFGLRFGSPKKVAKLYKNFIQNLKEHHWKRAVLLTASQKLHDLAVNYFKVRKMDIIYGKLPSFIIICER